MTRRIARRWAKRLRYVIKKYGLHVPTTAAQLRRHGLDWAE